MQHWGIDKYFFSFGDSRIRGMAHRWGYFPTPAASWGIAHMQARIFSYTSSFPGYGAQMRIFSHTSSSFPGYGAQMRIFSPTPAVPGVWRTDENIFPHTMQYCSFPYYLWMDWQYISLVFIDTEQTACPIYPARWKCKRFSWQGTLHACMIEIYLQPQVQTGNINLKNRVNTTVGIFSFKIQNWITVQKICLRFTFCFTVHLKLSFSFMA